MLSLLLWSLSRVTVCHLFSLGQIFCTVLPLSEAAHLLLTISTIALSIISLQLPRYSQYRKLIREFDGRALYYQIIIIIDGNIPMTRYPYDTNIISVRHIIVTSATLVHHTSCLVQPCDALRAILQSSNRCYAPLRTNSAENF